MTQRSNLLRAWFDRLFSDPQLMLLIVLLGAVTATILLAADILAPFLAAVVLAYLLQVLVARLERHSVPAWLALGMVFALFVAALFAVIFVLTPLLVRQLTEVARQAPTLMIQLQALITQLPETYPTLITPDQANQIVDQMRAEVLAFTQGLLASVGGTVIGLMTWIVYLIIVPLMVFFLVKDRAKIVVWLTGLLPGNHDLAARVWADVNHQLQNYVGGKVLEIIIVAAVTYAVFALIGLDYALLLAVITGLSVLIPYVGAAVVTLPVAAVAWYQWGFGGEFAIALAAYGIIQALDGNVLVPFLFSEAVDLHPVAIIVAILFFGGIWGLWGVFFAIPLAVVVKAIIAAWPRGND